jgi:excisionase family DNA binding protein
MYAHRATMGDDLLTVNEAARRLRVSRATITRWIRLGQLQAAKLPSGVYRIHGEDVEKLLRRTGEDEIFS